MLHSNKDMILPSIFLFSVAALVLVTPTNKRRKQFESEYPELKDDRDLVDNLILLHQDMLQGGETIDTDSLKYVYSTFRLIVNVRKQWDELLEKRKHSIDRTLQLNVLAVKMRQLLNGLEKLLNNIPKSHPTAEESCKKLSEIANQIINVVIF